MPVRPDVARKKLLDIGETVGNLRSWFPITVERLDRDIMLRWAVEHGLHLAAESLFDAGNHNAGLARLDDFEAFVADVELWLARGQR